MLVSIAVALNLVTTNTEYSTLSRQAVGVLPVIRAALRNPPTDFDINLFHFAPIIFTSGFGSSKSKGFMVM
jgi:hypothetical protein